MRRIDSESYVQDAKRHHASHRWKAVPFDRPANQKATRRPGRGQ
jgi:hypothetical protein